MPWAGRATDCDEGDRRIDPMAVEADIDVAPVDAGKGEPVDEFRRGGPAQPRQHVAPARQLHLRPALQPAGHRLDALARRRVEGLGLVGEARRQALGQRPHGAQQGIQRVAQGLG